METMKDVYASLKGSRLFRGEFQIQDFTAEDYEMLWEMILRDIIAPKLNGEDFYHWLGRKAKAYYRARKHARNKGGYQNLNDMPDYYDPLSELRPEELNTRQQLAIFKFFIYRQTHSWYVKH